MKLEQLILHIEALVFSCQNPLSLVEIVEIMSTLSEEVVPSDKVSAALEAIQEKYDSVHYPFYLANTGGGYQFLTKAAYHQTIMQLNGDKYIKKLSTAAMETLSIIAYKQPITKSEIEFIRGVSADYSIQKLLEKELIVIAGRNEDAIGKPLIYATSKHFMDYLGINSAAELPQLKEVANMEIVFPSDAALAAPEVSTEPLVVGDDGQLKNLH